MKFMWFVLLALLLSCAKPNAVAEKNLARAQRVFAGLHVGMVHEEACKALGVSCHLENAQHVYGKDFGRTFSKNEYTIMMYVEDHKIARLKMFKPAYQGNTRKFQVDRTPNTKNTPK